MLDCVMGPLDDRALDAFDLGGPAFFAGDCFRAPGDPLAGPPEDAVLAQALFGGGGGDAAAPPAKAKAKAKALPAAGFVPEAPGPGSPPSDSDGSNASDADRWPGLPPLDNLRRSRRPPSRGPALLVEA